MLVTIKSWLRTTVGYQQSAALGRSQTLTADTGFYSARNAEACAARGIDPFIAIKREQHHPAPLERFAEPGALPADATLAQAMAHKLKPKAGRTLHALRKQTVEPALGIINSEELEAWTSPTLKPYDFQPEGGSIQGVSDASVFHS